jgi:ribosomal protein L23
MPPLWKLQMPPELLYGPHSFPALEKKELLRHWLVLRLETLDEPTTEPTLRCPLELTKPDIRYLLKEFYDIEPQEVRTANFRGIIYTDEETLEKKRGPDWKKVYLKLDYPLCIALGGANPEADSARKISELFESMRITEDEEEDS